MTKKKFFNVRFLQMCSIFAVLFLISFFGSTPKNDIWAETAPQSDLENPAFTFTTTKDTTISTKANPNETTVLIFGHTKCGYTRSTLNSVSSCDWVKRPDIRVIFADTNFNPKENVTAYEEGYACPDMTFCYDVTETINLAVWNYKKLCGLNENTLPFIVLIDKNNKVQNMSSGTKTADEILTEIKKFENIDESVSVTPPSDSNSGVENFAFGLKSIDGTTVSTKAPSDQTTVLLFGYTTCGLTKGTLQEIDQSDWVSRSDIRVIFADTKGATLDETKAFAQNYSSGKIIFCHDEAALNWGFSLNYLSLIQKTGGTFPYIVLIDKYNKIQLITLGPKTSAEIIAEIEKFANNTPSTGDGSSAGDGNQNTDDTKNPATNVPNVTGLAAVSTAKTVKLTWNPVSNAAGYVIYQYNQAEKTWTEKASVDTNTLSYTIKKLTPATEYRFAVKAFFKASNGTSVFSDSYTESDTATAPNAVKFRVKAGRKKATIKWNKVKGADGYTVYYKTKTNGAWKKLKTTKGTSFTKTKLKSRKTYYFTVKAYKKYQNETYTSSFSSKKAKIK